MMSNSLKRWMTLLSVLLLAPQAAQAHSAFSTHVQHESRLTVGRGYVDADVCLTFYEVPSLAERRRMDANRDGRISDAELQAYRWRLFRTLSQQFALRVDGQPQPLAMLAPPRVDLWKVRRVTEHHLSVAFRLTVVVDGDEKQRNVEFVDLSALESPSIGDITVCGAKETRIVETTCKAEESPWEGPRDVRAVRFSFVAQETQPPAERPRVRAASRLASNTYAACQAAVGVLLEPWAGMPADVREALMSPMRQLASAVQQMQRVEQVGNAGTERYENARGAAEAALAEIKKALDRALFSSKGNGRSGVLQVEGSFAEGFAPGQQVKWQFRGDRGVAVVRMFGARLDAAPLVKVVEVDVAKSAQVELSAIDRRSVLFVVIFRSMPEGESAVQFVASGAPAAPLQAKLTAPALATLRVKVVDADTGQPTAAAAAVVPEDNALRVPEKTFADGLKDSFLGDWRVIHRQNFVAWDVPDRKSFYVDGAFELKLPPGRCRLVVGKGLEYAIVTEDLTLQEGQTLERTVTLRRWVNMGERGWWSGDNHVHHERSEAINEPLRKVMEAEDLNLANMMRMGDSNRTYFEQYGFGKAARYVVGKRALVSGQECPRTNELGHTMALNLTAPVRDVERYWLYDFMFDGAHAQGGVAGYCHNGIAFNARLGLTMDVPRGKVDFLEVCQFQGLNVSVYYDFLNLGFKLTPSAGSDVPWSGVPGEVRNYVYIGRQFVVDDWFKNYKAGAAFVTNGPMIELTVDGQRPGADVKARKGQRVRVKARAWGHPTTTVPQTLEVVVHGEVVKRVDRADAAATELNVELDLPIEDSLWLAARCANGRWAAHTAPIYVTVNGHRFWKLDAVPRLLDARLSDLKGIADMLANIRARQPNHPILKMGDGILQRADEARKEYERLRKVAEGQK
jgi:hypothetical protein